MTELTEHELKAINRIIVRLEPAQRERMLADLAVAEVEVLVPDRSMLRFHLPGHIPSAPGQAPLTPEAKVRDLDNELLEVVLFEDADGRLFEFELVRYAQALVLGPDWSTLEVDS
ncbi:hypothetical protein CSW58_04815 [Caulobacter sp. B11]|uniref:hypothetical protein n=1 Tax=Caulobacter sp. B11 TaxID=2048899 RepID=UPI000C12A455|nr:hypothetical protein [Caulobacter sp. B11]PHY13572.1 hypothetical protein CSW58_04815 [Caulobacter sp. B11]